MDVGEEGSIGRQAAVELVAGLGAQPQRKLPASEFRVTIFEETLDL